MIIFKVVLKKNKSLKKPLLKEIFLYMHYLGGSLTPYEFFFFKEAYALVVQMFVVIKKGEIIDLITCSRKVLMTTKI